MKKIILLFLSIITIQISKAQTPQWLWALSSNGGDYEYANGISVDSTGHFFIGFRGNGTITFGTQSATAPGANNPFVGGFDTSGTCNWLQEYTYSYGEDYPWGFCRDKFDNVYSGGVTNSGGYSPMFVEKYDKNGNPKWQVTVSGGGLAADGLAADGAKNVYVVGAFQNAYGTLTFGSTTLTYNGSNQAIFIAKMDSNGNWLWAKMVDGIGANDGYDVARGIAIDQYANIYVTGGYYNMPDFGGITVPSQNGNPHPSLYVAEYDSSGNSINVTTATNAGFNNGDCCTTSKITVDSCDNFYVTGYFQGTAQFGNFTLHAIGNQDVFVAKATNAGVWQWANSVGSSGGANDGEGGIALDKTSDVYVGGSYQNGSATLGDSTISGGDIFIAKYANSNGALQWVESQYSDGGGIGGLSVDNKNYMYVVGSYKGSIAFGSTTLNATSNSTVFVAKLDTVAPRRIIPTLDSSYCPGSTFYVPYSLIGSFNSGNVFTVQLSDSTGSFANPLNIGDSTTNVAGSIKASIPDTIPPGTTYLIRVISSNPGASSYANGCGSYFIQGVYINDFYITVGAGSNIPVVLTALPGNSICNGQQDTLTISGGHAYVWTNNSNSTDSIIIVNPTTTTTYNVVVTKGSCTDDTSIVITVGSSSSVNITAQPDSTCPGAAVTLTVPVVPGTTYIWTPTVTPSSASGDTVVANPTITTGYSVTGASSSGCPSIGTDTILVYPSPPLVVYPPSASASTCPGVGITLKVVPALGSGYTWSPATGLYTTTGDSVVAAPFVATTYTVTGIDSQGCASTGYDTVYVKTGDIRPVATKSGNVLISSATQGNQWYENGSLISGATNETYAYTDTGCYWVSATNIANGCSTYSDTICITTGINLLTINPKLLSIYPNPTGGELYINISSSVAEVKDWNLQITDVLGRTVYIRLSLNYSNNVDLSNLPGGMYFITVTNSTARAVYPLVKQ